MEDSEEASSEDNISIESPPHKASQAIRTIDLTRDKSPASIVAEVDLTDETPGEKELMDIKAGQPADVDRHVDPVSVAIHTGIPSVLVDSDDEDAHFSSDSDNQSDDVKYDDGASSHRDSMDEQEDSDNGNGSDREMDREGKAGSELKDFQDKESERASGLASTGFYGYLNHPIPELSLRSIIDASDNIVEGDEEDDESDFGLSDAGVEGMRALFDDELVDNAGEAVFEEIGEDIDPGRVIACEATTQNTKATDQVESPKHVTFASIPPAQVQEMTSNYSHFNIFALSSQPDETPSQKGMNARQPSPSDAAMVKTAAPSTTLLGQISNPIRVHHLPSQDFQKLTAQSLGEKTGKHAFFAAREDNRAKISAGENDRPRRASLQTAEAEAVPIAEKKQLRDSTLENLRERKRRMEEETKIKFAESAKVLPTRTFNISKLSNDEQTVALTPPAAPPLTTLPYLDDHTQAPHAIHTRSPEPDMTSAVTYNESRASMASANKYRSVGRSGISISDIVERSSGELGPKNLKRKSDDISEAIEDEIRIWATSSTALNDSEGPMDLTASASKVAIREEQSEIASTPAPETSQQRPTKRLRKIVESVGYVALGGATLFGALVLSAPDFL